MNLMIAADFGHNGGLLAPRKHRERSDSSFDDESQHLNSQIEDLSLQRSTVSCLPHHPSYFPSSSFLPFLPFFLLE
jgi:hypothetical protein